jgi:hypothetical protein
MVECRFQLAMGMINSQCRTLHSRHPQQTTVQKHFVEHEWRKVTTTATSDWLHLHKTGNPNLTLYDEKPGHAVHLNVRANGCEEAVTLDDLTTYNTQKCLMNRQQ